VSGVISVKELSLVDWWYDHVYCNIGSDVTILRRRRWVDVCMLYYYIIIVIL